MDSATFVRLSRVAAATAIMQERQIAVAPSALYVVWQAKILDHWKLLLSTDAIRGVYVEVTFNGRKDEFYVDVYEKRLNNEFTQTDLRGISAWDAMRRPTPEEASEGFVVDNVSDDERPYCPVHGDLLAGVRSERFRTAPAGHESDADVVDRITGEIEHARDNCIS